MDNNEKRDLPRVNFETFIEINSGHETLMGEVINLSLKGVLVKTPSTFPKGTLVDLIIQLHGSTTELSIELKGTVSRHEDETMAIVFKEMELDSYVHLKNIIFYSDKELHEFTEFL